MMMIYINSEIIIEKLISKKFDFFVSIYIFNLFRSLVILISMNLFSFLMILIIIEILKRL